jgi:hypothetical protein
MSTVSSVERDERTIVVENASYHWAYLFLSFGMLVIVAYRSFIFGESAWDLLLLVVLGGGISIAYQGFHNVLTRRWAFASIASVLIATILAATLVWFRA